MKVSASRKLIMAGLFVAIGASAANAQAPVMINPAADFDVLAQPADFEWTDVGADSYRLMVGSIPGGGDYYNKGTTLTTATVDAIPAEGQMVFVRITAFFPGGLKTRNTYTYLAPAGISTVAEMTTPPFNGDILGQPAFFSWTDVGADSYWLTIGTTPNGNDLYSKNQYTATSRTVYGLPTNGDPVYVRLTTKRDGVSYHEYYDYLLPAGGSDHAVMSNPVNDGDSLGQPAVFEWTDVGADSYWLTIGTSPNGNELYSKNQYTATSQVLYDLPTNGMPIYVRLTTKFGSNNHHEHYEYVAYNGGDLAAEITDPVHLDQLSGTDVVFTRTETGADNYWLTIGSTLGGNDYFAGFMFDATKLISDLPEDGSTVFVRLRSLIGGDKLDNSYEYTAAVICGNGLVHSPEECDDGNDLSGDGCSSTCTWEMAAPMIEGDLIITEIMADPAMAGDSDGEWFEIYNPTTFPMMLDGVTFFDGTGGPPGFSLDPGFVLYPGEYFVMAAGDYPLSGVNADFVYSWSDVNFNQTGDALFMFTDPSLAVLLDIVDYAAFGYPVQAGASFSLDPTFYDDLANDDGANWCYGFLPYDSGDLGTPGYNNPSCAP